MKAFLLLFLPGLVANLQDEEWKTYETPAFSISYPMSWELNASGYSGTEFIILQPRSEKQPDFSNNVNLVIQNLEGMNIDLPAYAAISKQQIEELVTEGKVVSSQTIEVNGIGRHEITYTGKQGRHSLTWLQYYWVIEERAYVLTFTCVSDSWEAQKTMAAKVMNSFAVR